MGERGVNFNGRKKEMASLLIYFHAPDACFPGFFANASRKVPAYFFFFFKSFPPYECAAFSLRLLKDTVCVRTHGGI
jgi:hypothetical protein